MKPTCKKTKRALLASLAAAAAVIAPSLLLAQDQLAPESPAQDQSRPQAESGKDGIENSIESLEKATDRQMDEAKKAARDALESLKAAYADLKAKAAKEWDEQRPEYERRMADAEKKLDELTKAVGEKWEEAKQSVADSLRDMSRWIESYEGGKPDDTPAEQPKSI